MSLAARGSARARGLDVAESGGDEKRRRRCVRGEMSHGVFQQETASLLDFEA
jgi:hypothetical protein